MPQLVVVGSYGVGLTMTLRRVPGAGETVLARSFVSAHGGKGSNQAVGAARLGASVSLCTVVGDDEHGREARRLWADEQVGTSLVHTLPGATMVGFILVEDGGENRIAIAPGVLDAFGADHLAGLPAALADAEVLVVGLEIPVPTAHEALRLGRAAGVTTVLNPAPAPPRGLPDGMLALVDHLTPNRSEAMALAGATEARSAEELLSSPVFAEVPVVALTLGGEGVLLDVAGDRRHVPAEPVRAVDTTGAGDAFTAAYAVSLAGGHSPLAAARFAVRAAAHCVTIPEVVPSLPRARDLDRADDTIGAAQ